MKFLICLLAIVAMVAFAAAPSAAQYYPTTIYACPTYAAPVCCLGWPEPLIYRYSPPYSQCRPSPCIYPAIAPNPRPYDQVRLNYTTPMYDRAQTILSRKIVPVPPSPPVIRMPKHDEPAPLQESAPDPRDVSPIPTDRLADDKRNQPYFTAALTAPRRMSNPNH